MKQCQEEGKMKNGRAALFPNLIEKIEVLSHALAAVRRERVLHVGSRCRRPAAAVKTAAAVARSLDVGPAPAPAAQAAGSTSPSGASVYSAGPCAPVVTTTATSRAGCRAVQELSWIFPPDLPTTDAM
jgi:hypothetical protein